MTDLKKGEQRSTGATGGVTHPSGGDAGENNQGAEFGTHDPDTAGKNTDADSSGISKNQGHGHPREERNLRGS